MKVLKFGGTSIGNPKRMKNVLEIVNKQNALIALHKHLFKK